MAELYLDILRLVALVVTVTNISRNLLPSRPSGMKGESTGTVISRAWVPLTSITATREAGTSVQAFRVSTWPVSEIVQFLSEPFASSSSVVVLIAITSVVVKARRITTW